MQIKVDFYFYRGIVAIAVIAAIVVIVAIVVIDFADFIGNLYLLFALRYCLFYVMACSMVRHGDRTSFLAGGDAPIDRDSSTCVPGQAFAYL